MIIKDAEFISSAVSISACPAPDLPEYAFIGRSNVGKSSLINMLVNKKGLAKISATPGKTRTINHYRISATTGTWYLADLPGYGYAKISQSERKKWERFVRNYLRMRESLICTFVLVDSRLAPQKIDLEFMLWMGEQGLPFAIVFTKWDKLSVSEKEKCTWIYKEKILEYWSEMPNYFLSSAEEHYGKKEMLDFIENTGSAFS
ncbi:MAG: YihA family ribosome biogenesis GTP-binding protein [Crocinitomicaceae bacterium]|nr:YihA family ribosome biogenesis GTP-binding protein [Crocinitomicaceae bacterium]